MNLCPWIGIRVRDLREVRIEFQSVSWSLLDFVLFLKAFEWKINILCVSCIADSREIAN